MPVYITRCTLCGTEEEIIMPMTEDLPPCRADNCGGQREKVPARTAAHFKGGGWTPRLTGGRTE